jgi:hypothetical protein
MAQHRVGRGAAQAALAAEFARAAERDEGMGQSRGGGAGSLNRAALKEVVTAAVQDALGQLAPAPAEGEAAAAATAQQLSAALAELRSMINLASPAQGTVVVKKANRYELGQTTSREKARPLLAPRKRETRACGRLLGAPTQTCCPLARRFAIRR